MKKIKNKLEEQNFIDTAPENALIEYISECRFRPCHEKWFMLRENIGEAQYYYIGLYGLVPSAARVAFEQGKPDIVEALLAKNNPQLIKIFLDYGQYQRVKAYVDSHDVLELDEQKELKQFDERRLMELAAAKKLSNFAKCDILARGSENLVNAVIRQGNLQAREKEILWNCGSLRSLELLLECEHNLKQQEIIRQIIMLRFGKFAELKAAVCSHRFHAPAEKMFLQVAPLKLVRLYVQRYHPQDGDELMFSYLRHDWLIDFLKSSRLMPKGEAILVERWQEDELLAYIDKHYLTDKNEVNFIRNANHEMVMYYLMRHSLCDKAQMELIARGDEAEIIFFYETYPCIDEFESKVKELGLAA